MEEDSSEEENHNNSKLILSNLSIDEATPANIPIDVQPIPVEM